MKVSFLLRFFIFQVKYVNATYTISPFPPTEVDRFIIGDTFSTSLLARLITCFIRLGRKDLVPVSSLFIKKKKRKKKISNHSTYHF